MNYEEAVQYLYAHAPMFQKIGSRAYKTGLENTFFLDWKFGSPHRNYKTIHVAGTNGKGSTSHLMASVLQCAGYKVGLYTSPHLKDFRERIRIDGEMIPEQSVIRFIEDNKEMISEIEPSFFEITTALAFLYFAQQHVDVAVIEVGLGGRLDCTNIVCPELSVITNVSFDHMAILGDTLEMIAHEKAGIIKPKTPVVVGEYQNESIKRIFESKADAEQAPLFFAQELEFDTPPCALKGIYQEKNTKTVMAALSVLRQSGFSFTRRDLEQGFADVVARTGLQGRWQMLGANPTIICDTGHNEGGIRYVAQQLIEQKYDTLRIVFGMVSDKDITAVLSLLPVQATYYFTKASIPRALNEQELQRQAGLFGLCGSCFPTVREAFEQAKKDAGIRDFIFVGGSNFIVAEII